MQKNVDLYFTEGCLRCSKGATPECKVHQWSAELAMLRSIVNSCGLEEECKWGMPCYTINGKNVLIISAFKDYCSINFFQGALINDEANILSLVGENAEVSRIFRVNDIAQIEAHKELLKAYIFEAAENEKLGRKVQTKKEIELPVELIESFKHNPELEAAFMALTPGRQKSYVIHINGAKQEKTKYTRIEKCIPKIKLGKGFNER
ncbi:Uncharacterized conserved protein YdeI, YjbR/CyaY-like superfamily, DUF1801 family [Lishizhenia tianjinensis]|uniref:Uncharacterized conserved protein YdeI, YjbR/CyaY-like superfamily, DUF1801 family n=1 Tax=Lishizhenia tianjinensis TaxID=477690 RepID=A0A1I6Y196_9FLAO|nr:YdeI/OmpD-associated family protein [Lishizhenia tianjinensis]SFT43914.1 Uncharacterized conserved protein YdeI, YjbR/CyaY-like superfamily, DUF1801 family [Lishizhenia tianjinensis]